MNTTVQSYTKPTITFTENRTPDDDYSIKLQTPDKLTEQEIIDFCRQCMGKRQHN